MEQLEHERICACALGRIFGYEPSCITQLVDNLGSTRKVFSLSDEEKYAVFGPHSKYRDAVNDGALEKAEAELSRLRDEGCVFVSRTEKDFPALLLECPDCPAGLYVKSSSPPSEIFNRRPSVAVIGTRDISLYGKEWTPKIIMAMADAREKPSIVSGLAFGVDITAHMAALAYGLPTIAVLPTGIDDIYPKTHRTAAGKIAGTPGSALITDYPPGTGATALNFLRRNRIIAGMSGSTILIESRRKGGGMMTSRLAAEYGRNVFALPGRVEDVRSEGCNALIGEKIAEPIVNLASLPEALGLGQYNRRRTADLEEEIRSHFKDADTGDLCKLMRLIRRHRGITPDELSAAADMPYPDVAACVSMLENEGFLDVDLLQRCTIHAKFD